MIQRKIKLLHATHIDGEAHLILAFCAIEQLRGAAVTQPGDGFLLRKPRAVRRRSTDLDSGAVSHWSELTFVNMTPGLGQYFGAEIGVLLVHCGIEDLPLIEGDVILKIGRQAPADASQAVKLFQEYEPDEPVTLQIWRHGQALLVEFRFDLPGE
jgi:S1-C subfamily serine protease